MAQFVDWDLAAATAGALSKSGPAVSYDDAMAVVSELRALTDEAAGHVASYTGLTSQVDVPPVRVVDRKDWAAVNIAGLKQVINPLVSRLTGDKQSGGLTEAIGSRVTGAELGVMLGFLGNKVLGQFDPFYAGSDAGSDAAGRLLLVAPNIVHVERELDVDPHDFRLWVCLHEETHRVQFTAVPWMRDHLHGEIAQIIGAVQTDPAQLLAEVSKRIADVVSGKGDASLIDLLASPEQKKIVERVTGVMSLLEGHADVVMDDVGPEVIPSVADIRRKFTQRRKGVGTLDRLLRRLLGLDQKMAQYRDGAVFVRAVIDTVGMDGFNAVWAEPANLPSKAEIHDPASWVARVHG
jgi:coenzyme F420 biosynthesis associated uncharacterized protein